MGNLSGTSGGQGIPAAVLPSAAAALLLAFNAAGFAGSALPAEQFAMRHSDLAADDVNSRFKLARWAEAKGLTHDAMRTYREVLLRDVDHKLAYKHWVDLASDQPPAVDADRRDALRKTFGGMKLLATDHFLVLYDADEGWARRRAALLEKAHEVFYYTFRRMGFHPWPLSERLVCVLYQSHEDYLGYAKRVDGVSMGWASGYYSSQTNRIVFYDDRNGPHFKQFAQRVAQLEARENAAKQRLKRAVADRQHGLAMDLRKHLREIDNALRWFENRKEVIAKMGNASKTVHEAVHQLAFNSRLQRRSVQYPFWLSEGMATNFETDQPFKDFGPLHPNPPRARGFREAVSEGRMIPLKQFVALRGPDHRNPQRLMDQYSQAWALFRFLFRYRRDDLRSFLEASAQAKPGPRSGEQLREQFVDAFGSLDRLEKRFAAFADRPR